MKLHTNSRYPALGVVLTLLWSVSTWPTSAHAQAVPTISPQTARFVESTLARAAETWGAAGVLDGGAAPAVGVGAAVLSSEAGVAGVALTQAACLLTVSVMALQVHLSRSASIVTYGNPFGQPAADIAFPLHRQTRAARARLVVPKPFAVPTPAPVPVSDEGEPDESRPGRVYATYRRYNRTTGRYYSGRTSAVIDLNRDWDEQARAAIKARTQNRHADENVEPTKGRFRNAALDVYAVGFAVDYRQRYRDVGYLAIRGREQQLIDFHGGAQSDTTPGTALTENAIRGVARNNPFGELFHTAANLHFGEMAPYTGHRRFNAQNP